MLCTGLPETVVLADNVCDFGPEAAGAVLVTGSHGGVHVGQRAATCQVRAAVFHDAGIGFAGAGLGALAYLAGIGTAAASVATASCRIGDSRDTLARGTISHVNQPAAALGVEIGESLQAALPKLARARPADAPPEEIAWNAKRELIEQRGARHIVLVDSLTLVRPEDAGHIVVTGSHGGLVGNRPEAGLAIAVFAAVFNDAGRGIEDCGIGQLAELDRRGVIGLAVDGMTARVGEARSTLENGVLSAVNARARERGINTGERCLAVALRLARERD